MDMNKCGSWPVVEAPVVQESLNPATLQVIIFIAGFAMVFGGLVSFLAR